MRWIGEFREYDPDMAKEEITARYLGTCGPATAAQLGQWIGIPESEADEWIRDGGGRVTRVNIEGNEGWLPRDLVPAMTQARPTQTVRLLPESDPYTIGAFHQPASAVDPNYREQIRGANGWIQPALVAGSDVVGRWTYERKAGDLEVTVRPFKQPESWVRQEAWVEAVRLPEFFGCDLVFS